MRKSLLFIFAMTACSATSVMAQEKFELGKPNNDNYRYLDEYKALKEYIDYTKYPNFKLGIGTTVPDYLQKSTVYKMTNKNFTETVAGNAMKMASCVDNNGNMNFTNVKNYVETATEAGLSVYGHTLAWHSQQPKGWLLGLLADKPDPDGGEPVEQQIAIKSFLTNKSIGWSQNVTPQYDATNGLTIHRDQTTTNYWDVQFIAIEGIPAQAGKTCTMTITIKGSKAGTMHAKMASDLQDPYSEDYCKEFDFSNIWQDIKVEFTPATSNCFVLLQCGDFVGDIYIKEIKMTALQGKTIPQTKEEMHDALVGAMEKWISGMMEACNGKVKGWDLVNEAISGGGDDGEGNYILQHSKDYNPEGNPDATWDVGGDNFFWQDYLGDLDYVRQACRLARKYGPKDIKLFINDYNLESDWDENKKIKSLINWIKKWEADGDTKIDGIGTQMHISCFEDDNIQEKIKEHITKMFQEMAASGKLCRVSEMDMGYVRGSNRWGDKIKTNQLTEAEHKRMADFYEWIIKEYFRLIPSEQQWGICQWCPTDAPDVQYMWRGGEPVGIWDENFYRKHVYAGFAEGLGGVAYTAPDDCIVADGEICVFFETPDSYKDVECRAWNCDCDFTTNTGATCSIVGTNNGNNIWKWIWDGKAYEPGSTTEMTPKGTPTNIIFSGTDFSQTDELNFKNGGYYNENGILQGIVTDIQTIRNNGLKIQNNNYWYDLNGRKLSKEPQQKGVYIYHGKKILK